MSTITKEWLLKTIAELEEERDATPGAVNEDAAMALAAMKLALASLEANGTLANEGTITATQFKPVADLYEMQFDDGRTCAFHTDGAKAVQWLLTCDGNKVQEYVKLDRYQKALSGNSPVIPDGWVLVPIEPTYQMCEAMGLQWESPRFPDRYKAMIAAVKNDS